MLLLQQEPSYFTGSDVRIRDPDMDLLHFAVAFKGVAWADADSVPLMIMMQLLGGWNKAAAAGGNMASRAPPIAPPCTSAHIPVQVDNAMRP